MLSRTINDGCSFVQQGPDGEGGTEHPWVVALLALSAQRPLSGKLGRIRGMLSDHHNVLVWHVFGTITPGSVFLLSSLTIPSPVWEACWRCCQAGGGCGLWANWQGLTVDTDRPWSSNTRTLRYKTFKTNHNLGTVRSSFAILPCNCDAIFHPSRWANAVCVVQLKPLPRAVVVNTVYEVRNWSYQVQHGAVWGNQELSLSGRYSAPPALEMGNHTLQGKACTPSPHGPSTLWFYLLRLIIVKEVIA